MYLKQADAEKLYQLIEANSQIIIHRHQRPDPDAIGSQLGLKTLIQERFPNKKVLAAGSTSQGLKWLGKMDNVTEADYEGALVIVTDTANQPRIDGHHYNKGAHLVKIDHHPPVDQYGDLQIVYPEASSTCEIIAEISRVLADELPMSANTARLLYAGLIGDTGRFLHDSTTPLTFEVASRLAQTGINLFEISDHFCTMTLNQAKFQAYVLEQLQISQAGVGQVMITQDILSQFQLTEEQTNAITGLPGTIEGIDAWIIIIEQNVSQGEAWRCRLRSKGPIINTVAAQFGGGGHPKASGVNIHSRENLAKLLTEMDKATTSYRAEQAPSS